MFDTIKWNDKTCWIASGLTLPKGDVTNLVVARCPITHADREFRFKTPEEFLAWKLTSEVQRQAAYYGYDPSKLDYQTYVLSPTGQQYEGRWCELFWRRSPLTDYRLVIHRSPSLSEETKRLPDIWRDMILSDKYGTEHGVDLGHQGTANTFLEDLLKASIKGDNAVKDVFEECGHPYVMSRGFLDSSSRQEKDANLYE